jgi:hypothetical protein
MRALITLLAAPVVSWIVSYSAEIALGIAFGAQEELIVAMFAQVLIAMAVVTVFGAILLVRGGVRALAIGAITMAAVLLVGLAVFEAITLAGEPAPRLDRDLPLLIEVAVPALLGVAVQWWLLRRYVAHRDTPDTRFNVHPVTG